MIMNKRNNSYSEMVTRRGIELSGREDFASALKVMLDANIPTHVIQRVLSQPRAIRNTDK